MCVLRIGIIDFKLFILFSKNLLMFAVWPSGAKVGLGGFGFDCRCLLTYQPAVALIQTFVPFL